MRMNDNPCSFLSTVNDTTRRFPRTLNDVDPVRRAAWFEGSEEGAQRFAERVVIITCAAATVALIAILLWESVKGAQP